MSSMLRDLVYEPILDGRLLKMWPAAAPAQRLPAAGLSGGRQAAADGTAVAAVAAVGKLEGAGPGAAASPAGSDACAADRKAGQAVAPRPSLDNASKLLAPAGPEDTDDVRAVLSTVSATDKAVAADGFEDASDKIHRTSTACSSSTYSSSSTGALSHQGSGSSYTAAPADSSNLKDQPSLPAVKQVAPEAPAAADDAKRQRPSIARKLIAGVSAFGVSGLWHELVFSQMSGGHSTRGVWSLFFLLQVRVGKSEMCVPDWACVCAWAFE